jgi:hypothetical protein
MNKQIAGTNATVNRPRNALRKRDNPHEFALMPTELCKRPPRLSPFEWAVLAAIQRAGLSAWAGARHEEAYKVGARAMARERDKEVPFEQRSYTGLRVQSWGEAAYQREMRRLREKGPPEGLVAKLKATPFMAGGDLKNRSAHHHALDGALDRFTQTVDNRLPPPLRKWTRLKSGRLKLDINGAWLKDTLAVPLPLPCFSAPAIALLLLLQTLWWGSTNKSLRLELVCELIGVSRKRGLQRAMDVLNEHLEKRVSAVAKERTNMAEHYSFEPVGDDRIRFIAPEHPKVVDAQQRAEVRRMCAVDEEHARGIEEDKERENKSLKFVKRSRKRSRIRKQEDVTIFDPPRPRLKKVDDVDYRRTSYREFSPYD